MAVNFSNRIFMGTGSYNCPLVTGSQVVVATVTLDPQQQTSNFFSAGHIPPPFVVVTVDKKTNKFVRLQLLDYVLTSLRFEEGKVTAVPWKYVFELAAITTKDHGARFFNTLSSNPKQELLQQAPLGKAKRRKQQSLADFNSATLPCKCSYHSTYTNNSCSIILLDQIDEAYYESHGLVFCKKCASTSRRWGGDGFLNEAIASSLYNGIPADDSYAHFAGALRMLFETTNEMIRWYRYGDLQAIQDGRIQPTEPTDLLQGLWVGLFSPRRMLLVPQLAAKDLDIRENSLKPSMYKVLAYHLFGITHHLSTEVQLTLPSQLKHLPRDKFECAVVSLFYRKGIQTLFRDTARVVYGYVQVYVDEQARLNIAGVMAVHLPDLSAHLAVYPEHTVVAWPAQFFTHAQVLYLASLRQKVILAGTPFVMDENRRTVGQAFTQLIQTGHDYTLYGPVSPTALSKLFDTFPVQPLLIETPALNTVQPFFRISCPATTKDKQTFYNPYLLATLIFNTFSHDIREIKVTPSKLLVPSVLDELLRVTDII